MQATTVLLLAAAEVSACAQTHAPEPRMDVSAPNAQMLLNKVAAHYKEVKLIGVHMSPPTVDVNAMIASTDPARVGNISSPGDLKVMFTEKPKVEFKEKDGIYEIAAPLYDANGKLIGMMVELMYKSVVKDEAGAVKAEAKLQQEFQQGIPSGAWMFGNEGK